MKKKGFTLIELLAVIVILAVITIIAVPKILDVIEKSRESATESSIKLVKDAIRTQVSSSKITDSLFNKEEDGCYIFNFPEENANAQNLKLNNKDKISGTLKYCNGKFSGPGDFAYNGNDRPICKRATKLHTEICTQSGGQYYYCSASNYNLNEIIYFGNNLKNVKKGTLTSGDAFDCDINGDGEYNATTERFYYLKQTTTNNANDTAVLIYYSNTNDGIANNTSSSNIAYDLSNENYHGPRTAIKNLPTISQWTNTKIIYPTSRTIVNNEGTTNNETNAIDNPFNYTGKAARFLTYQEISAACGPGTLTSNGYFDNCQYLMENTKYSKAENRSFGYWLENPKSTSNTFTMFASGNERIVLYAASNSANYYGVRPVIEVLKSNISY